MSKKTKLTAEEKAKLQEEEKIKRYNQIMALYKGKDGVELLGQDKKNTYLHNPDNDRLLREVVENSRITVDLRAYTDVFIMDVFMEKPKNFVTLIKRISGKDLTNPLFKDKHLILTIQGDTYYGLSEQRKKYYLLKELSRLTWNEEKEQYKVLKYEYQNNENLIDLYGVHPTEEAIADL
jgi:hypothetical protein